MSDDRRAMLLLGAGLVAGIAMAGWGLVRSDAAPPGSDAVALVNGVAIGREQLARFAAAVAAERKQLELEPEMRRRLLERMIDDELLFQRAEALGLARHEPMARRAMVAALVASVTADAEVAEPSEAEKRRFYREHAERFTRPGRLRVEAAFVSVRRRPEALALERAREIRRRLLEGEDFDALRQELGDDPVARLPAGPLPIETLRRYLGPTAASAAARLRPGEVGAPVRGGDGYFVLRLAERREPVVAPYEEMLEEVRGELLRSRGDAALRGYLADLREDGSVEILDPALLPPEPGA